VATALMAVARKIIVLDFEKIEALEVFSLGAVVLALGGTYCYMLHAQHREGGRNV
ncbi:MAG TPA: hypothetical protein EYH51_17120, partial [Pseudomonas pachastrellae]|nr:hypothetical protein [Halopseudomonas pachastrellae]